MSKQFKLLTMALVLVGFIGCSGSKSAGDAKRTNDVREIGLAFHEFFGANAKPPTQASDLKPYIKDEKAYALLSSSDFVFIWGVGFPDMAGNPDGSGGTILGYEKDAPEKGGLVLLGDGVVKNMTAEEFKKMPKAKKKGN